MNIHTAYMHNNSHDAIMQVGYDTTVPAIDLFSLYILFYQFRPRDVTPENSLFQGPPYLRAHVGMICQKT